MKEIGILYSDAVSWETRRNVMKMIQKGLAFLLILAMLLAMAGCRKDSETTAPTGGVSGETGTYTVSVRTQGGMALSGIVVYVYADSSLSDLKQYGETDANGQISFTMPKSADYVVALSGTPKGYQVESYYAFAGNTANITLSSSLVTGESLTGATLGVGDVMYDFSVMTASGETVTLSGMLAEKKMVLINFWYSTCGPCATEFPFMEEAYQMYQEDVGIIALDPLEDSNTVATYQQTMGLSFPMAACQAAWSQTFNLSGYPTSVIVDRYGVICALEIGALTSRTPFISAFEYFTADNYTQKLFGSISELVTRVKPTFTMEDSDTIGDAVNVGDIDVTYRPETEEGSAEYSWPFILTEKNGVTCLKASNQQMEDSYAILYADVYLKAGQAVGFEYLASCEQNADILYVIVNDNDIYQISGSGETESWKSCYPWVALEDGYYELALCYMKDSSDNVGDDTVYIRNMRVVEADRIDTPTYIPRFAAVSDDGFAYTYADIVYNDADGYYHVGAKNGPLLLADLMHTTQFNEEKTVFDLIDSGTITVDGHNYYDELVRYCNYASNSTLNGYCTVNRELATLLMIVADVAGFEDDENEWLKLCEYYQVYGTDGDQLEDPIAGLAPFSAYKAKPGKNVATNYFYYNRVIMPRGLLAEFIPTTSGVYRITSRSDSPEGVEGWIMDANREIIFTYEHSERMYNDDENVSMLFYMEAGTPYYIDIAFWDLYEVGYIYYDIEYVGQTCDVFRLASPGYFTYDTDETGTLYYTIAGGVDVVLGSDGKYYVDLGKDAGGNQRTGSVLYADFTGISALFSRPISTVYSYDEKGNIEKDANGNPVMIPGLIDLGGFDFSKSESDEYILSVMKRFDNDVEATDAYLHEMWGESYAEQAANYQIEDVFEGRYHGKGEDMTGEIKTYLSQIITSGSEDRRGCVVVTQRLAELLQMLMDKYTFANIDHSWTKLCYYYDHLGPQN